MQLLAEAKQRAAVAGAAASTAADHNSQQGTSSAQLSFLAGAATTEAAGAPLTLVARNGILQNPSGKHNGVRVWGGGILRLPQTEWLSWEIDLLAQGRPSDGNDFSPVALDTASNGENKSVLRRSQLQTQQQQLSRIDRATQYEAMGIPTVHTLSQTSPKSSNAGAAIWLQAMPSGQLRHGGPADARTLHQLAGLYRQKIKQAKKNPNRVGAKWANERLRQMQSELKVRLGKEADAAAAAAPSSFSLAASQNHDSSWLPSFGGVWNEGSRSQHRKAFRDKHADGTDPPPAK